MKNKCLFYVYVIESIKNNRLYVGCTKDLNDRLQRHNSGSVKSTKRDLPYKLVFAEEFNNLSGA